MRQLHVSVVLGLTALSFGQTNWKELEAKSKDPNPSVRGSVIAALKQTIDFEAVPILDRLAWDRDQRIGDLALEALDYVLKRRGEEQRRLEFGKNQAEVLAIWQRYEADRPYWKYEWSGRYLAQVRDVLYMRDETKIANLMKELASKTFSDDRPPERDAIEFVCGTGRDFESDAALELLVSKRPDVARALVRDPKTEIRARLLLELSQLTDPQDVPLVKLLFASPNITLRDAAVRAIDRMFFAELMPIAVQAGRDKSVIVRYSSVQPLTKFVTGETIEVLSELLADKNHDVGIEALSALDTITNPKFDLAILRMLGSADKRTRERALIALAKNQIPQALHTLLSELPKRSESRRLVIGALAAMKEPIAHCQVIAIASDRNDPSRHDACRVLSKLGDKGAEAVLSILSDRSESERTLVTVLNEVGQMHLTSAANILSKLRGHPSHEVRNAAVCAMKALGIPVIDP